jgi:salicylate hydroxylase
MRAIGVALLPSGKHVVSFEDGSAVEADLVIGSDGIKSTIRSYVAGQHEHKQLASVNTATYRALVSISALKKDGVKTDLTRPLLWVGSDRVSLPSRSRPLQRCLNFRRKQHCVTYPIRGNELVSQCQAF